MPGGDLGTFRKVDPHAIDDDPFWSTVRRRHPGVDVVVLPAGPDQPPPSPPDEAVAEVRAAWDVLRPLLSAVAGPAPGEPTVHAGAPGGPAAVLRQALTGLGQQAGRTLLAEVALALGGAGWLLRPSSDDGRPVLDARQGSLHLRAEAGPGATVLAVSSWQ